MYYSKSYDRKQDGKLSKSERKKIKEQRTLRQSKFNRYTEAV